MTPLKKRFFAGCCQNGTRSAAIGLASTRFMLKRQNSLPKSRSALSFCSSMIFSENSYPLFADQATGSVSWVRFLEDHRYHTVGSRHVFAIGLSEGFQHQTFFAGDS